MSKRLACWLGFAAVIAASLETGVLRAWWVKGHEAIAEAAAQGLPEEVPAFFRAAGKQLAHCAGDPDRWKNRECKHLRAAESPDHFLDLEDYGGKELPADRFKAIEMLIKMGKHPDRVGMLPYAIMENFDRLSVAFYDLRQDPENSIIRAKCIVHAGVLAHLTGDCAMPLHTTINYDGKKQPDGNTLQKGIHARIDGYPEKNQFPFEEIARELKAVKVDDVWKRVLDEIKNSHEQIEKCYEFDSAGAIEKPTPESREFIMSRCRVGAQFTMDLWYTAWLRSATLPAPY